MRRIKKSTLKRAWAELDRLSFDPKAPQAERLLNAAALQATARLENDIAWRQALPESTALEFQDRSVMLTFQPASEFQPAFPVSRAKREAARAALDGQPEAAALECLALKALEPNFEWLAEPVFPELEEASAGSSSP